MLTAYNTFTITRNSQRFHTVSKVKKSFKNKPFNVITSEALSIVLHCFKVKEEHLNGSIT